MKVKDLIKYSEEQLKEELSRREEYRIPKLIDNPDLTSLKEACGCYIQNIFDGYGGNYDTHGIVEAAMEALYGEDVWDGYNKKIDE